MPSKKKNFSGDSSGHSMGYQNDATMYYGNISLNGTTNVGLGTAVPTANIGIGGGALYPGVYTNTFTNGTSDYLTIQAQAQSTSFLINVENNMSVGVGLSNIKCPVHKDSTTAALLFNVPFLGIKEEYCMLCVMDLLRKSILPLGVPRPPHEPGASRYDIAKGDRT